MVSAKICCLGIIFFFCFLLGTNQVLGVGFCHQRNSSLFFSSPFTTIFSRFEEPEVVLDQSHQSALSSRTPENIPFEVLITSQGFEPREAKVKINQPLVWKNERSLVKSLVYGVREISAMKSPMIHPGENFTWTFSRPGVYTYVDAVVLGTVGKIIVQ